MMRISSVENVRELCNSDPGRNRKHVRHVDTDIYSFPLTDTRCVTDPLIHHGRHFGRTVHALCSVKGLFTNGLLRAAMLEETPDIVFEDEYGLVPHTTAS